MMNRIFFMCEYLIGKLTKAIYRENKRTDKLPGLSRICIKKSPVMRGTLMLLQFVLFNLSVLLRYRSQRLVHRARIQNRPSLDFKWLSPFGLLQVLD
jgi:hypothetical protein